MIGAGVDGGSRAIKVVVMDAGRDEVIASGVRDQGIEHDRLAGDLLDELLGTAGRARRDVARTVATGYTRNGLTFADTTVSPPSTIPRPGMISSSALSVAPGTEPDFTSRIGTFA